MYLKNFALLLCGFVCVGLGASNTPTTIGQVVATGVKMDGIAVPSGATIFSPSLLRTGDKPAAVRLVTGELLHLSGNSAASFEKSKNGEITVALNSGTLSYNRATGMIATAASPASVSFPQRRTGAEIPAIAQQGGIMALLTQAAHRGDLILHVNDASRMDEEARLMVKTRDGKVHEVHYAKSIDKNKIVLKRPLEFDFQPEDMVFQGCECDEAVGAPGDGVVAILTKSLLKGQKSVTFNSLGFVDPEAKTLIKRRDGSIQEVHHIESLSGNTIVFEEKMKFDFQAGDVLIQGCNVPPFAAFGWWNWKKAFLLGALVGGGGVTPPLIIIQDEPTREECSRCLELYGQR